MQKMLLQVIIFSDPAGRRKAASAPEEKEQKMAKLDGKKLLACCANGAGSSLMMENAIKKVMKRNGIKPAELRHCPVSEGKTAARNYDVVFCARTFVKTFEGIEKNGTVLIPLKNVMSDKEIEAALKEADLLD